MPTPTLGAHRLLPTAVTSPSRRQAVSPGLLKATTMIVALLAATRALVKSHDSSPLQLPLKVAVKVWPTGGR